MSLKQQYPKLQPIKFPSKNGKFATLPIRSTKGKSTQEIILEMRKLSKKDLFATE